MLFCVKFTILLFMSNILCFQSELFQRYEGDFCTIPSSGTNNGICKLLSSCPSAMNALQTQGILPVNCGFKHTEPIVCCDGDSSQGPVAANPSTRRPQPTTERMQTTLSVSIQEVIQQVGDKSKQKCEEYGTYVNYKPTGLIDPWTLEFEIPFCDILAPRLLDDGTFAKRKEFPHMALVGFDGENNTIHWHCSGSLISENFVLSSAHCTYHTQYLEAKYILLGDLELDSSTPNEKPQQISIKNIIRHPNYRPPSNYHDIALFELERDAVFNSDTRPACLFTSPSLAGTTSVGIVWGRHPASTNDDNKTNAITLEILTIAECDRNYRNRMTGLANGIVEETQLCAGSSSNLKDICQGDSGGPLQIINEDVFCTHKIIGISSFGNACGTTNSPGIYTRVSAYIKWIEDIVWP